MNRSTLSVYQRRCQRALGGTMIEFALAAIIFFMFLLGAILWGMTMWEINTLQYAVERGARCAILPVPPSGQKQCGEFNNSAAANAYALPGISGTNFTVQKQVYSYSSGTTSQSFTSACVSTQNVLNPFASPVGLTGALSTIGTIVYCRSTQN